MGDKSRNLIVRTLSGIVLLAVVLAAAYGGVYAYGAFLLLILVVGMWEFYKLAHATKSSPQAGVGIAAGIVLFLSGFSLFVGDEGGLMLGNEHFIGSILYFMLLVPLTFVIELFRKGETPLRNVAVTLAGIWYVALPMTLMFFIPLMLNGGVWRAEAFLFYLFIVWANDVCAYLVGMTLGRHRLCERISPKKSWEGFFGGVAGALGMGAIGASVVGGSCGLWLGLAAIVAVSGVLGDLVESMFKREAGVKDSGNILPGHGGMLDRFDALMISSPMAFVYLVMMLL